MPAAEVEVEVGHLADIYMTSGLTRDDDGPYRGFVTITVQDAKGNLLRGQADPDEVRTMALRWLEAAEAADQDRIVMTMLTRDLDIPPQHAAGFIRQMRTERDGEGDVVVVPGEDEKDGRETEEADGGPAGLVDPAQDHPDGGSDPHHAEDPE